MNEFLIILLIIAVAIALITAVVGVIQWQNDDDEVKKAILRRAVESDFEANKVSWPWQQQVEKGIELLQLCADLQSEKDGIDRPKINQIDPTKTLDQFARDIQTAATNMSALNKLFPLLNDLSELGRKLEADGKITVDYGDSFADAALNYVLREHGLTRLIGK